MKMPKLVYKCPVCGHLMIFKRKGVYECKCGLVLIQAKDHITFRDNQDSRN